ncbi:MAG: RelA/SpoT domain-containing protein [Deltaproteobacteria bacterium]|nr:RelA/SpoT domain-containing protein [Deltaproteobacteria bacterium]
MQWIEPEHSKERVKKAGKYLVGPGVTVQQVREAIPVFFNWRSAHAFPMQIMLDLLRKNAIRIDRNALVVQRLKRVNSILNKLIREEGMSLSRMEDIAGCRAVLDNTRDVRKLYINLKNSRTKNILYRERDYILNPKESGYRGIHLVYKYNGQKDKYRGLLVELQLRSKIQHAWATAVEVVGTFTKQALKASYGEPIWLEFFKLASVEFAKLEGCKIDERYEGLDTLSKLKECMSILDIDRRLRAFNVAVKTISSRAGEKGGAGYYILFLDLEKRVIKLRAFDKSRLEEATNTYNEEEQKYSDDDTKDLVLVSANSLRELRRAYPNYFSDTNIFSKHLDEVIAKG